MLTQKVIDQLNAQINWEFYSSNLYLQMSAWCSAKGLDGSAAFLKDHATEEMDHMQRLFDYVSECGALPILGEIKAPPLEWDSINAIFKQTYEHELFVTQKINELVDVALMQKDHSTFNFLQWYVSEQHEEEKLFKSILDKMEIIGTDGRGLYHFDQVVGQMVGSKMAGDNQA